jgi:hypothetical protein
MPPKRQRAAGEREADRSRQPVLRCFQKQDLKANGKVCRQPTRNSRLLADSEGRVIGFVCVSKVLPKYGLHCRLQICFGWDLRNILPVDSKAYMIPHLVDGYVAMKMDAYVKAMWGSRAEWTWYRLEYQSRGTVHLHGCVRLRNIPDLNALYVIAHRGRSNPESASFVDTGTAAEQQICNVADALCSAWNPSPPHDAILDERDERGERPEPHPCSIYFDDVDHEKSRVNEVQRHRHVDSYCLRKGKCRFGYPLPLSDV